MSNDSLPPALFVTGTDTEVGKSLIAAALLCKAQQLGRSTAGLKPVASGCDWLDNRWQNADARLLQRYTTLPLSYEQINPVALPAAVAPHLAAAAEGRRINIARLEGVCRAVLMQRPGLCVVEGAGGWRVPLDGGQLFSELPRRLNLPVVLVVGMRLGCINHALLSAEAIRADGLPLVGWVANQVDPHMPLLDENIATLQALLPAPCLGVVPFLDEPEPERVAACLTLT